MLSGHADRPGDEGQITVLVLAFTAIAALLAVAGIDASAAFLDRRALGAATDDAAVAAAGGVDRAAVYRGGPTCGRPLPVDPARAVALADASVAGEPDLRRTFARVGVPAVGVDAGTVTVTLVATARLPFSGIIGVVDAGAARGVTIRATAHARSPLTGC